MQFRNTLLLILSAAVLLIYIRFFDHPGSRESEAQKSRVVTFDKAKVDRVVLINEEERIELAKQDGRWFLLSPIKDKADANLVGTLLDTLLNLRPSAVLNEDKEEVDLKPFGVAKSNMRLQIFGENVPPEVLIGKNAAVEGQVYLRLANSNRIYVVPADLKELVAKRTDDFREKTLIALQPDQLNRMIIRSNEGEIEVKRVSEHWQIEKPIRARANDELINKLVTQLTRLQAKGFVGGRDSARLAEPFGTVTLYAEGSDKPTSLSLIEAPGLDDGVYGKLSTRDSIFILDKIVGRLFKAKPNDLRDRYLLRLNFDTVDRIRIQPSTKPAVLLTRDRENWAIDGHPAKSEKVNAFVNRLLSQKVVTFAADTGSELQKYGLQAPLVKIVFSSFASENTPETKAGEKPIATILLGRVENGEIFAKLEEEPFIVSISPSILEELPDATWKQEP